MSKRTLDTSCKLDTTDIDRRFWRRIKEQIAIREYFKEKQSCKSSILLKEKRRK